MGNPQVIEDTEDEVIYERLNRLWPMIETRAGRNYVGAGSGQSQHILEMNCVVRRFAGDDNQLPAFFQSHVCSAVNQIRPGP
jgi:hypothetical protein